MLNLSQPITISFDPELVAAQIDEDMRAAWATSRPNIHDINIWDVMKLDAPITEFATFQLDISAPILIRELMASARNHVIWAQTSRVMNLSDWPIFSDNMAAHHKQRLMEMHADMCQKRSAGAAQDEFRLGLPLCYMTRWTQRISFRDVIRIERYLSELVPNINDLCVAAMVEQFATDLRGCVARVFHQLLIITDGNRHDKRPRESVEVWYNELARNFKPLKLLNEKLSIDETSNLNRILTITIPTSWALRAQLVRHRHFIVQDSLRRRLEQSSELSVEPLSELLLACITATHDVWLAMIRSRSCWIAQADLWAPLIKAAQEELADEHAFSDLLPCANGTCPFNEDARQRLLGTDPGVPCPRHILLSNPPSCLQLKPELIRNMRTVAILGSDTSQKYWNTTINQLAKRTNP